MDAERWRQVRELFEAAQQCAPDERGRFLVEACGDNEELRREVASLLGYLDDAQSFMEQPAVGKAEEILAGEHDRLTSGARLSHYEIIRPLGAGGMGEVYLAQDTKLHRRVALKLLPARLAADQEAGRRFLREARAAAALEHPNICAIHEIGEEGGRSFIVMQYVEGETLADKLRRERLDAGASLDLAIQIADALAEAHAQGIIHRDIKPANVIVTPRGQAKVLDFGLAKFVAEKPKADGESETGSLLSTPGMVMGTVPYMSPEQVRGEKLDTRTDVFSFGVLLYELLTGQQPFTRPSSAETVSAILTHEPPFDETLARLPEALRCVVRMCLAKDRAARYQTANDLLLALRDWQEQPDASTENGASAITTKTFGRADANTAGQTVKTQALPAAGTQTQEIPEAPHRKLWLWGALAVGLLALSVAGVWWMRTRRNTPPAIAAQRMIQLTIWPGLDDFPSIAPDGHAVAYCSDHDGSFEIYVKALTPGAKELQLTADRGQNLQPAWSPDGQRIAYYSKLRGGIWVIPASGGAPKQLTEFGSHPAWSPDGKLIAFQSNPLVDLGAFARNALPPSTLWLVAAQGGEPRQLTQVGNPPGGHGTPAFSPDGKRIAFEADDFNTASVWTISSDGHDARRISTKRGYAPNYTPDGQSILFTSGGVWQARINPKTGEALGEPVLLNGFVIPPSSVRRVSFSADGKKLAYSVLRRSESISSVSLKASSAEASGAPAVLVGNASYRNNFPVFSPDGQRIAFSSCNQSGTGCDIWLANADGSNPTQLTTADSNELTPSWFPDQEQVAYISDRTKRYAYWAINLNTKREKLLLELPEALDYVRLSPDGKQVAFNSQRGGGGVFNVWIATLTDGAPKQLTFDKELMGFAAWSPDGKHLAFQMKRGDDTHVMIMPSTGGTPAQLTFDKGQSWMYGWSPDGDKILFAGFREGYWNVWWVSRTTKKQRQLTDYKKLNSFVRYTSWSPRGDRVAYEYSETSGNIWVAELK